MKCRVLPPLESRSTHKNDNRPIVDGERSTDSTASTGPLELSLRGSRLEPTLTTEEAIRRETAPEVGSTAKVIIDKYSTSLALMVNCSQQFDFYNRSLVSVLLNPGNPMVVLCEKVSSIAGDSVALLIADVLQLHFIVLYHQYLYLLLTAVHYTAAVKNLEVQKLGV